MTRDAEIRRVLAKISNERWAKMLPQSRINCRVGYRWMRDDGVDRRRAQAIMGFATLAGETAGHKAVAS